MVYVVTLASSELSSINGKLRVEQRLTKSLPKERKGSGTKGGLPMVLVVDEGSSEAGARSRTLSWIGVVSRYNTVGAVDESITVDPLRECKEPVHLDGPGGLLRHLPDELRREFDDVSHPGAVGGCTTDVWRALEAALRQNHSELTDLLDWLITQASPPVLDSRSPADRAWQEQQDAVRTLLRIAEFPTAALAAWRRPGSEDAPYLAGLVPQPVEGSLIDHDIRAADRAFELISDWHEGVGDRCDIHVLYNSDGRRLEVVNVNATGVESRLGTDMIYYHEPTHSFVLVQYKRLDPDGKRIYVDERHRKQLDRLERVARLSRRPERPSEWRLGNDPCFLKLAYWPTGAQERPQDWLTPGMYLPLSYVRLLLDDPCTLGARGGTNRVLGYDNVGRHLINTQFIELVKHGLAGTVGTSVEQLKALVQARVVRGQSVMLASELSSESVAERQTRTRSRGAKARRYGHHVYGQESLF